MCVCGDCCVLCPVPVTKIGKIVELWTETKTEYNNHHIFSWPFPGCAFECVTVCDRGCLLNVQDRVAWWRVSHAGQQIHMNSFDQFSRARQSGGGPELKERKRSHALQERERERR